jgi:hypothetical protein
MSPTSNLTKMRPVGTELIREDRRSDGHEEANRPFSRLTHTRLKTSRSHMFRLTPCHLQAVHNYAQTVYDIFLYTFI